MECADRTRRIIVIARIERIVAQKLESGAVKGVCSGLRDHIHQCARKVPVLGIEAIGQHTELLQGVQHRNHIGAISCRVLDTSAIHQKAIGIFPAAINRNVAGAGIRRVGSSAYGGNARLQAKQIKIAAAVQRQSLNFFIFDNIAQLRDRRFHLNRSRLDRYFFRRLARLELKVNSQALIDGEPNAGLLDLTESRSLAWITYPSPTGTSRNS